MALDVLKKDKKKHCLNHEIRPRKKVKSISEESTTKMLQLLFSNLTLHAYCFLNLIHYSCQKIKDFKTNI